MKREGFRWRDMAVWMLVIVLAAVSVMLIREAVAISEEPITYSVWVMCQPDSHVNLRSVPDHDGNVVGRAYSMDELVCDMLSRDGRWVHVVAPPCDAQDAWIALGFVTVDEPEECRCMMQVEANGRVAVWATTAGQRRRWIQPGAQVEVYQRNAEWSVTSLGFIHTKHLQEVE